MKENDYLIITGNSLQSIGAFLGVEAALLDINVLQKIIILGNSMQSLGAGLQAYQGVSNVLKDEEKMKIVFLIRRMRESLHSLVFGYKR